jgi:hypothetical protein
MNIIALNFKKKEVLIGGKITYCFCPPLKKRGIFLGSNKDL